MEKEGIKKRQVFCLMPWIHLHVGDFGMVKACCVANIPLGNCNDQSLAEIWNGNEINKLREKFEAGIPDNRCSVCLNREKSGAKSIRLETFDKFHAVPIGKWPVYYDIRFSNTCNFRCRTCWHGASSKWFRDAQLLRRQAASQALIKNVADVEAFIQSYGEGFFDAKEFYFAGGEPLVTEAHYLLLKFLIANRITDVHLRYNTNLSRLVFKSYRILEMWSSFKKITILASIDDYGKRGEIIRKELCWSRFLDNLRRVRKCENVKIIFAPTVSVLNVFTLPDFVQKAVEEKWVGKDDWYLNLLERPYYYNIQALPNCDKHELVGKYNLFFKWMERNNFLNQIMEQFKAVIPYAMAADLSKHWSKYLAENNSVNELRSEVFNYKLE